MMTKDISGPACPLHLCYKLRVVCIVNNDTLPLTLVLTQSEMIQPLSVTVAWRIDACSKDGLSTPPVGQNHGLLVEMMPQWLLLQLLSAAAVYMNEDNGGQLVPSVGIKQFFWYQEKCVVFFSIRIWSIENCWVEKVGTEFIIKFQFALYLKTIQTQKWC